MDFADSAARLHFRRIKLSTIRSLFYYRENNTLLCIIHAKRIETIERLSIAEIFIAHFRTSVLYINKYILRRMLPSTSWLARIGRELFNAKCLSPLASSEGGLTTREGRHPWWVHQLAHTHQKAGKAYTFRNIRKSVYLKTNGARMRNLREKFIPSENFHRRVYVSIKRTVVNPELTLKKRIRPIKLANKSELLRVLSKSGILQPRLRLIFYANTGFVSCGVAIFRFFPPGKFFVYCVFARVLRDISIMELFIIAIRALT